MNSTMRFAVAAAAVVAIALLGIRFLLPDQNIDTTDSFPIAGRTA